MNFFDDELKIPAYKPKPMNWQFVANDEREIVCAYCFLPLYVRVYDELRQPETSIEMRASTAEHSLVCTYWKRPPRKRGLRLIT